MGMNLHLAPSKWKPTVLEANDSRWNPSAQVLCASRRPVLSGVRLKAQPVEPWTVSITGCTHAGASDGLTPKLQRLLTV